ncbi:Ribulose-1,5 bisphosphate carboxylase/oxygenase large subunit N-methyltransferase, chloroplastic [Cucurbita argyrosperma subsp. argyrosperma]|nr:Ribulose-1,5 bisphosphate carboxylase/oxygenase large subunit N-methyltransferase, chloroplastic [Cucurbita argyrosperma subsp. argyrosperma]
MANSIEAKLELFLQWLQVNGAELRGCTIKYSDLSKGCGLFSANDASDGVLLVVPLNLAITPMRVLQDPLYGPECRAMYEEGEVDDRFLMNLFLMVERLRENSSWKPYLDVLPARFGNPLWFTDNELLELKGTTLHRATELQKNSLQSLYEKKVKKLVNRLLTLDGSSVRANSIFWARALNIPMPHAYVFPKIEEEIGSVSLTEENTEVSISTVSEVQLACPKNEDGCEDHRMTDSTASEKTFGPLKQETVWVEGLVPGIDFCNHDLKATATWEVDGPGSITGVPFSMYLLSGIFFILDISGKAGARSSGIEEVSISYGNKGNEELLYLYGFVIENNPDDYLMVHYPLEAIQNVPFSDSKMQLLEVQKAEMRCLLPRRLLDHGFHPPKTSNIQQSDVCSNRACNYSWSGQRKIPAYLDKLVFPEKFLTALRTISMQEDELMQVSSLLAEVVGPEGDKQPTETDVEAAVWEACGDSGALQLLVDLLQKKMMDLEEGTGTLESDTMMLKEVQVIESMNVNGSCPESARRSDDDRKERKLVSRNQWCSIVYRQGQKQLTTLFLKEAEHALQLSLSQEN